MITATDFTQQNPTQVTELRESTCVTGNASQGFPADRYDEKQARRAMVGNLSERAAGYLAYRLWKRGRRGMAFYQGARSSVIIFEDRRGC